MTKYVLVDADGDEVEIFDDKDVALRTREELNGTSGPFGQPVEGGYSVEPREETTDEDNNVEEQTYTFIGNDDQSDEQTATDNGWSWDHGDHTTASSDEKNALSEALGETMADIDAEVDSDMMAVLEDAQDLVSTTSINQFECGLSKCGLGHSHPDWKHDIRASPVAANCRSNIPGFNISEQFAAEMEFKANCHCGANEAAMLVKFFPYFTTDMFKDEDSFRGVLEVAPDALEAMYRVYNEDGASVSRAAARVASRRGENESEMAPLGVRDDIVAFFERRQQMEQQAQKAPISQETRQAIDANREELEEATSQ